MAQIGSNNTFTYNGQAYFFQATIFTRTEKYFSMHGLDSDECIQFEYYNQINSLAIPAILTYEDRYGLIDKYLEKPYVLCSITFGTVETEIKDGVINYKTLSDEALLNMDFLVSKIEIVKRQGKKVIYKIHMISQNWMNLVSNITYSNYGKKPEQIFKIIKNILKLAELDVDDKTFDDVKSDVKLSYITNGNDTPVTCIKYLLSKMMYYKQHDDVWKFIYYDEQVKKYKLFDINKISTSNGNRSMVVSLFNSTTEQLFQIEPLDLNTTNSFSNSDVFTAGFTHKITDYDYQHNVFVSRKLKNEDIVDLRNKTYIDFSPPYFQKYEKLYDTKLDFSRKVNYWNDDLLMSQYNNLTRTFCENNGLIIECAGEITRKPSDFVNIDLDRKIEGITKEDPEEEDDIKHRYAGFEGAWLTSKVHHFVNIRDSSYRARVFLFRNYITDTIEKSAK